MRPRLGLYAKLTLVFVLFATLLLAGVGSLTYAGGRAALETAAMSELSATANEKENALNMVVEERQEDLAALAAWPQLAANVEDLMGAPPNAETAQTAHAQLVQELQSQVAAKRELAALFLLAPESGQIIASTHADEEGQFREDRPYFIGGQRGPFVQNPEFSLKTQIFEMTFAVPVPSATGKLLAVLAGEVRMDEINRLVTQRTGLRQTDDAFLVNTSNLFVTQPRLSPDPAVLRRGIHTVAVQSCLAHNNGVIAARDYRGVPAIIGYRWLPERQLCLIVKLDQTEAFAPIQTFALTLAGLSGLGLLVATLLALGLARAILQPVLTLQQAATRFGRGELEQPVAVNTRDELGELAQTFNQMAASLRQSQAELEQRVQDRTAELRASEQRWATTLASIGDAVIATDAAGRITFMNTVAETMTGWRLTEAAQSPVQQVFHIINEQTRQVADDPVAQALATQAIVGLSNHTLLIRKNGTKIAIDDSGAPIRGDDGEISGVVLVFRDITERRRRDEALRQSETRYRTLFNAMTEGYTLNQALYGPGGTLYDLRVLDANPAAEIVNNLQRDALVGKTWRELWPGAEQAWWDICQTVFAQGQEVRLDNHATADGRWYEVHHFPAGPDLLGSTFTDITQRKQAEQVILAQTEQLQAQNEELNAGREELQAQNAELASQQEELLQARDELEVRVRERTHELEKANSVLEVQIEERRQAEEQVRQNAQRMAVLAEVSQALVAAGPNYRLALNQMARTLALFIGDACIVRLLSDDNQRLDPAAFYHADPKAREVMGAALDSEAEGGLEGIAGQVFQTQAAVFLPNPQPEDLRRQIRPRLRPYLDQNPVASLIAVPLLIQAGALGTLAMYRLTLGRPYTAEDLKLLQSLADRVALAIANAQLYRDLENALAQEKATRQQLVQAEKLTAMGRVVGSVAHELNNPLQTITNCLFLTAGELPSESPIHQYLEMASSETNRLTRLVAQLREVYRPRQVGQPERLNLVRLLAEVQSLLAPQLERQHVQWHFSAGVADAPVNGMADQLKQVFINLSQNAAEAMQPAGGRLDVAVHLGAEGNAGQVSIVIRDTGPGIAPESLDRLFEPFYTTKATGLGLGLSICHDIIQRHGGQIAVESQPGEGARFTVWLPLAP